MGYKIGVTFGMLATLVLFVAILIFFLVGSSASSGGIIGALAILIGLLYAVIIWGVSVLFYIIAYIGSRGINSKLIATTFYIGSIINLLITIVASFVILSSTRIVLESTLFIILPLLVAIVLFIMGRRRY